MTKQSGTTNEYDLNPVKMTSLQQMEIINGAVDAFLKNLDEIDTKRKATQTTTNNQLRVLEAALKNYAEPVTEETWDAVFKANVAERLAEARGGPNGYLRYNSKNSVSVILNVLKRATMGLTLAKHDKAFAPSPKAANNIKKYADEVGEKLQAAIDPATDKPRLRTIAAAPKVEKPNKLPEGVCYWLIGCADATKGINGANAIITGSVDMDYLKREARKLSSKFASFLYVPAPTPEPLPLEDTKPKVQPLFQNTAVYEDSFSAAEG
jgi:hypothetical protein